VGLLDLLTINYQPSSKEEIVELVYKALDYFPSELWNFVIYKGVVKIPYDIKVSIDDNEYEAFVYNKLLRKLREIKKEFSSKNRLLAITLSPILMIRYYIDEGKIKQSILLVHDWIVNDIGFASLFEVKENVSKKLIAHSLGHFYDLLHHFQPIDLMTPELKEIEKANSFCKNCKEKLVEHENFR
jgi:predicted Zn-dependent protease